MSTKTLRKRIALVAVSALGAGLLSVAPAAVAATPTAGDNNTTITADPTSSPNAVSSQDKLNIASVVAPAAVQATAAEVTAAAAAAGARSVGLLSVSPGAAVTGTATLLSTGTLSVYSRGSSTAGEQSLLVVSGGTIVSSVNEASTYSTFDNAAAPTRMLTNDVTARAGLAFGALIKPNAGVSTMTVSLYQGTTVSTTSNGDGVLKTQYVVTIAATSAAGTYDAASSPVSLSTALQTTTSTSGDVADANIVNPSSGVGTYPARYINFSLNDAYGAALATKTLIATSSAGNYVNIETNSAGSESTAIATSTDSQNSYVRVDNANPGKAHTDTVTVTWNGIVVAKKQITFTGYAAKMVIRDVVKQKISGTSSNTGVMFRADLVDSAGNYYLATGRESSWTVDSGTNDYVTAASITAAATLSSGTYTGAAGSYTCGATNAAGAGAAVVLKYTNPDGSIVKGTLNGTCSSTAYTYTASLDKASYNSGEIATLTVTFKDSKGNLVNDIDSIPATVSGNRYVVASLPQMTIIGTAPSATQTPSGGVLTLKYSVGTTTGVVAGSWTGSVEVASLNDSTVPQAAQSVSYKIAGDGSVSNTEVLAAIVKLIASINKQIVALQKLITKKK